jgi:hypothetical protein
MKQTVLKNKFIKASTSVWTTTVVVCLDTVFPTPSTSSAMKTPENAKENMDDHEPADITDIQMEYPSD